MDTFYSVLSGIRNKPNVQDVLVEVTDFEEDEEYWPLFSERVYVLTSAAPEEVEK